MITIIDYGLGNLASIANALKNLEIPYEISSNVDILKNAKTLILPGVGSANQGMKNLKTRGIDKIIIQQTKKGIPILGICLGMQLLLSSSEEGNVDCLELIEGKVKKFTPCHSHFPYCHSRESGNPDLGILKIPQIGWNQIKYQNSNIKNQKYKPKIKKIFQNIPNNSYFYFVNSFYCNPKNKSLITATTDYGKKFCSILIKKNIIGVQFHPEKSGDVGLRLLKNFYESSLSF